jgi:hypothetical protein
MMLSDQVRVITHPIERSPPIQVPVDMRFIVDQASQPLYILIRYRPDVKLAEVGNHKQYPFWQDKESLKKAI